MSKSSLFLVMLIFSCSFLSALDIAQAQFKPTVPEFTVKCVGNSYNVPPTQTTDPYKGAKTQQSTP